MVVGLGIEAYISFAQKVRSAQKGEESQGIPMMTSPDSTADRGNDAFQNTLWPRLQKYRLRDNIKWMFAVDPVGMKVAV